MTLPLVLRNMNLSKKILKHFSDLDPLVQQMHNLRQFISQARSAGKNDDAKLLEQNLRDLQVI